MTPRSTPRRLQLFVDGKKHAILVNGQTDSSFDAEDSIEFYGTGVDTSFTDTRVYWLAQGTRLGKRIKTKSSRAGPATVQSFSYTGGDQGTVPLYRRTQDR